jgi:hypothetical protein
VTSFNLTPTYFPNSTANRMAILGSLEASVSINGNKAPEYDDPKSDDTANVVSKYIEVAAGANFSLALTVKQEPPLDCDCISWSVYLDGDPTSKKRIHTKRLRNRQEPGKDVTQVIEGKTVGDDRGNYSLSKFRFGDLVISRYYWLSSHPWCLTEIQMTTMRPYPLFPRRECSILEPSQSKSIDARAKLTSQRTRRFESPRPTTKGSLCQRKHLKAEQ